MIYADFLKLDDFGRLILVCVGTLEDLATHKIKLEEGLQLTFHTDDSDEEGNPDDLIVKGKVEYDKVAKRWTAVVDWDSMCHASDFNK